MDKMLRLKGPIWPMRDSTRHRGLLSAGQGLPAECAQVVEAIVFTMKDKTETSGLIGATRSAQNERHCNPSAY
jgi:hypothetical protein